jgi:hypothetical protein
VQVEVVERDFTRSGKMMRSMSPEDRARVKGHLPFYSVDTREEADALIAAAVESGEFIRREEDGALFEATLLREQTVDNLDLAGERLAQLHAQLELG